MKRLLTIQDISCVGQCSTTVALPIISACGVECAILPPALLSNHTGGFTGWSFCDLTGELKKVEEQWVRQNIRFDAFYTGYVCESHIDPILSIFESCSNPGAIRIVDPAMADNGVLYKGFAADFPSKMARLVKGADYVLPNLTEAALLVGEDPRRYLGEAESRPLLDKEGKSFKSGGKDSSAPMMEVSSDCGGKDSSAPMMDVSSISGGKDSSAPMMDVSSVCGGKDSSAPRKDIANLISKLHELGAKNVVLTGVSFSDSELGSAISDGKSIVYDFNPRLKRMSHGTGDVFASVFAGAVMRGKTAAEAAALAADIVCVAIEATDDDHWYGVSFEKAIPELVRALGM